MKKRLKIISLVMSVILLVVWGVKIYDTYEQYGIPKDVYYGYGDTMDFQRVRYELKNAEVYSFDELIEKCGLEEYRSELDRDEAELGEQKYFLVQFELTALEENYRIDASRMYMYSEYAISPVMLEYIYYLNDGNYSINLTVGEPKDYYVVFGLWGCYYSDEYFAELNLDDIQINVDEYEKGYMHCFKFQ